MAFPSRGTIRKLYIDFDRNTNIMIELFEYVHNQADKHLVVWELHLHSSIMEFDNIRKKPFWGDVFTREPQTR